MSDNPIVQVRAQYKLTQRQMAAWFGVTRVTLQRWEAGEPPAFQAAVAHALLGPNGGLLPVLMQRPLCQRVRLR